MPRTEPISAWQQRFQVFGVLNDRDAAARGIVNGEPMRGFNDVGSVVVQAQVTPAVRPGQLIMYNGFEPYQLSSTGKSG